MRGHERACLTAGKRGPEIFIELRQFCNIALGILGEIRRIGWVGLRQPLLDIFNNLLRENRIEPEMRILHLCGSSLTGCGLQHDAGACFYRTMLVIAQEPSYPRLHLAAIVDKDCCMLSVGQDFGCRLIVMRLSARRRDGCDADLITTDLPGEII